MPTRRPIRYKDAGVNIDEAERAVELIKQAARRTFTRGVATDIGSFGAGYRLSGWKRPVLISSADGVGTKLKVAFLANKHDTVGQCLVNHCVNDIAVQGAKPIYFLDYFAVGKLDAQVAGAVVGGLAKACAENGCALIGGETAEMPGMYRRGRVRPGGLHHRLRRKGQAADRRADRARRRAAGIAIQRAAHQRLLAGAQAAAGGRRPHGEELRARAGLHAWARSC